MSLEHALALAGNLVKTEGAVWLRQSNDTRAVAERVYADSTRETWLLDEEGFLLCNT